VISSSSNFDVKILLNLVYDLALWVRLATRKDDSILMDEPMKEFMWRNVQKMKNVEMYLLPKRRPDMNLPLFPDPHRDPEETLFDIMVLMVY
jgi:hypothetical protein